MGHIHERHCGTQHCVEQRHPSAIAECVHAQAAVAIFVNVHHDKVCDRTTEQKPRQNSLAFRRAEDDLVLLKSEFRGGRRRENREENS